MDETGRLTGWVRIPMHGRGAVVDLRQGRLWLRISLRDVADAAQVADAVFEAQGAAE